MAAFPEAKQRVPELRMIVVAGPRIDPQSLPKVDGIEVRGYVNELNRHLAVCDLAVVQGGLATTMELTANKRPFLYFPLRHHFEQNFHVRYRLDRYHAGRCMDFEQATPEVIAKAIADEIGRKVVYREVEHNGTARAAARIAELICPTLLFVLYMHPRTSLFSIVIFPIAIAVRCHPRTLTLYTLTSAGCFLTLQFRGNRSHMVAGVACCVPTCVCRISARGT